MSTSTDGGLTWGPRLKTANNATGIGGQPVVQPNGTVIVPIANANETALLAFNSTNGGATWSATTTITLDLQPHRRRQPAHRPAALGRDRRRRQGLRRLAGLPLPQGLQVERHRDDHLHQRHDLEFGRAHPDRRHQQRRRSLHPRPGRRQHDLGQQRQAGADLLLLPDRQLQLRPPASSTSATSRRPTAAAPGAHPHNSPGR